MISPNSKNILNYTSFLHFQEEEEDLVESDEDSDTNENKPNGVNSSHNKAWRKNSKYFLPKGFSHFFLKVNCQNHQGKN